MYQEQPIDLIWDESSPIDTNVMGILTRAGFRPRSMGPAAVAKYVEGANFGSCVLCMHRRELPDVSSRDGTGAETYRLLRHACWRGNGH